MKSKYNLALTALLSVSAIISLPTYAVEKYSVNRPSAIVYARSYLQQQAVPWKTYHDLTSYHEAYMSNPSTHAMIYRIEYTLCAERKSCVVETRYKTLGPGESYGDVYTSHMGVIYDAPYSYWTSAITYVYGEYSDRQEQRNILIVGV